MSAFDWITQRLILAIEACVPPYYYGAQLRLTRLRPSGRGADTWHELHPRAGQQRQLYDWLAAHGEQVLTGDSFFHLAPYGGPLPWLNLCGAGRVVCLIDPVGDVYACPFAIHEEFLAGSVRQDGGFEKVWTDAALFAELRRPQTGGACASNNRTGIPACSKVNYAGPNSLLAVCWLCACRPGRSHPLGGDLAARRYAVSRGTSVLRCHRLRASRHGVMHGRTFRLYAEDFPSQLPTGR
jgi:radical SAM protein with 4Fe4S-binding SPASM domain